MMNGPLGFASKELEFSVAPLDRIQCTHIVKVLTLVEQTVQFSR